MAEPVIDGHPMKALMNKTNLAAYLAAALAQGICAHDVRAQVVDGGVVQFYIHPAGKDGETLDFVVRGNDLVQLGVPKSPVADVIEGMADTLMTYNPPERAVLKQVKVWADCAADDCFPGELRAAIDAVLQPSPQLDSGDLDARLLRELWEKPSFKALLSHMDALRTASAAHQRYGKELRERVRENLSTGGSAATAAVASPTAPRLTPAEIEATIVSETYTVMPSGRTTVCELTLRNGFTVRGESSVVCIENFDAAIGQRVARENARDKVWELEGYLLQDKLHAAR